MIIVSTAIPAFLTADWLDVGEENLPRKRLAAGSNLTSGTMQLSYWTARKTESVSQVRVLSAGTAIATPTLAKVGVYTVASDGAGTLVASTASDGTIFGSTFNIFTRSLAAPFTKMAGQRYALAVLTVAATAGSCYGCNVFGGEAAASPRGTGQIAAQSDLPASFTAGQVAATSFFCYGALLP